GLPQRHRALAATAPQRDCAEQSQRPGALPARAENRGPVPAVVAPARLTRPFLLEGILASWPPGDGGNPMQGSEADTAQYDVYAPPRAHVADLATKTVSTEFYVVSLRKFWLLFM